MFKNTFQSGFLSLFYAVGTKPLQIWDAQAAPSRGCHVKRVTDEELQSTALELLAGAAAGAGAGGGGLAGAAATAAAAAGVGGGAAGAVTATSNPGDLAATFISCPADPSKTLGIRLPFLVFVLKNLNRYCSIEVQVLDDKSVRRRFRASSFQGVTRARPPICTMPLRLEQGWNTVQLNLPDLVRRVYGTNYVETLRVTVHASCRLRRVYFAEKLCGDDELPTEFRLYVPA